MAPPSQITSKQKRKYTMLDDYVNAIQWENFTNVSAANRLDTIPRISLQERGDFSERSQLPSSSQSIMQRQQHMSLFSLLGLPLPASAPMFHSLETRAAPRDPTYPITGTSAPSIPMLPLSGIRDPHSDSMVPSSEMSVPFGASVLPSFGPRVPSSDPMFSSPGRRVPRGDNIVSSSEISVPFGASMLPSSGARVPYNDSMFLWPGTRAPHGGAMDPSSEVSLPMSASMLHSSGTRVPYSERMLPSSGTRVPSSSMVPLSETTVPFGDSMLPSSGTRFPSSDPFFPLSGKRTFSDPMFLPSETNVPSSSMFSSSGLRLPHSAPMFSSAEASVPHSDPMSNFSGTSVPHSDPMFLPSGTRVPYAPISSSPELTAQRFPSGMRAPCNVPLRPFSRIEAARHQSSQQSSLFPVSPEVHYFAPSMGSLRPQHERPGVFSNAPNMVSLAPQHGRLHNTPVSGFAPTTINTENTQKKARVLETGSSSKQVASMSPFAEELKTVAEFSQLLNEISIPTNMADDLSEDKLLVNSDTPDDSVWNTVDGNSEIDEMNNWWEKVYDHDLK